MASPIGSGQQTRVGELEERITHTDVEPKRRRLSARPNAAANVLEADDLQVAVKQVEVFVEHRKGRRPRR